MRNDEIQACTCVRSNILLDEAEGDPNILAGLRERYQEFNERYFNNELPIIPLKWGNMTRATAEVRFKSIGMKNGPKHLYPGSMEMVFSNKYKRPLEDFLPILLHEMIHVYFINSGDITENHGLKFMSKLKSLQGVSGIEIPLTDALTKNLKLTDQSIKPVGVVLRQFMSDGKLKIAYAMYSAKTFRDKIPEAEKRFARTNEQVELRIVTSKFWTEKAARSRMQRSLNWKTDFFYMPDDAFADLEAHSEVIWSNGKRVSE